MMLSCTAGHATEPDEGFWPELAGARIGLPAKTADHGFLWIDAFLGCRWPANWHITEHIKVQPRVDFDVGWLTRHSDNAITGGAGPVFVLERKGWPISLEAGSSSTLISRHDFGDVHLATPFQFTTHIGLNWEFCSHARLTYRFEHMSNAGIAEPNPGVNFHAIALAYLF